MNISKRALNENNSLFIRNYKWTVKNYIMIFTKRIAWLVKFGSWKLCQTEANKKWNKLKEGDKSSFSLKSVWSQRKFEGVDHFIEKKKRENASLFF